MLLALFAAIPATALASGNGHGLSYDIWLILAGMLLAAKLGGEIAVRLNQPPVLGELCAGIVLGNLSMLGISTFDGAAQLVPVEFLAELGVVEGGQQQQQTWQARDQVPLAPGAPEAW